MQRKSVILISALVLIILVTVACGPHDGDRTDSRKLKVVTTLFPLYDFARQIGKDKTDVILLLPPGVEAHTFEPRPADIARIERADCFIFTGRAMEPWVDRLLMGINRKQLTVIDASQGTSEAKPPSGVHNKDDHSGVGQHDHTHGVDPHIWLDPVNAMTMVDTIAGELARKDPSHSAYYIKNADAYKKELTDLDRRYRQGLTSCRSRVLVHAGHLVFGYLAKRYDLTYVSAYDGFAPNTEPTPRRLAELIGKIKKYEVGAIYYEELMTPRVAETLGRETGVSLLKLSGAHNVTKKELDSGVTFLQIMDENLENLRKGLQCR